MAQGPEMAWAPQGGDRTFWIPGLVSGSECLGRAAPATRSPRHIHTTFGIPQCPVSPGGPERLVSPAASGHSYRAII